MYVSARARIVLALLVAGAAATYSDVAVSAVARDGSDAVARNGVGIRQFMAGVACVESNGRYHARNRRSGAYGKYQIMPRSWAAWSKQALGHKARPTPKNQERVAHHKFTRKYARLGSWKRVAYWWLTGSTRPPYLWASHGRGYVAKVMRIAKRAAAAPSRVPARCYPKLGGKAATGDSARSESGVVVRVAVAALNVRKGPGVNRARLSVVRHGERLTRLDTARDAAGRNWLKVRLPGGRVGWVAGWLTRKG
ncbi:MAG TPA: SH3 domain-containing protein [Candidatus Limnocylindria bacterium]|nr:SH3 domain-containing protein [Candidatus Limnocylindria bacterium]